MGNDSTWVKLYRKSLSNEIRRRDPTAWRLFETLLLLVNSSTGTWAGGRYQLTEADGYLNSSTVYKALKRLEKSGMIESNSNTKYTKIRICNFTHYAKNGNTSSKNEVTTNEQPSNTLTRSKNIEVRIDTNVSKALQPRKQISLDIDEAFNAWEQVVGYKIESRMQANRNAVSNLIKKYTLPIVKQHIYAANIASNDKFSGITISDFAQLQQSMNDLKRWAMSAGKKVDMSKIKKGIEI